MGKRRDAQDWARLRLLCESGLDLLTISKEALAIVCTITNSQSAALLLTSENGGIRHLVLSGAWEESRGVLWGEQVFLIDSATYGVSMLSHSGPKVGKLLLGNAARFIESPGYRAFVARTGHQDVLDARVDSADGTAGLLLMLRSVPTRFARNDVLQLTKAVSLLETALQNSAHEEVLAIASADGVLMATITGAICHATAPARAHLGHAALGPELWPDRRNLPPFCLDLLSAGRPSQASSEDARSVVIVPGGRLEAAGYWLEPWVTSTDRVGAPRFVVLLRFLASRRLTVWRSASDLNLTPRQVEVAYWLGLGMHRAWIRTRLSISESVLRDTVRAVLKRANCGTQVEWMRVAERARALPEA